MRRFMVAALAALVLGGFAATAAWAAPNPNPSGHGQPGVECGEDGLGPGPPGFGSGGFANAETHYAGSEDTHSLASDNPKAVSQYDVACYQLTSNSG
jgi:hypothetical protein